MKTAEKFLRENVIGVNQEAISRHPDFLKSILMAMEEYADQFRQSDVIKSVCQKCGAEMEGATYKGYTMCHICREWQTVL